MCTERKATGLFVLADFLCDNAADCFIKINCFPIICSGTQQECQTVWIQIRADVLSVLIWVQTVCKGSSSNNTRLKSGNFGHQVNSDIHLQTVEIQIRRLINGTAPYDPHQDFHCLLVVVFYSNN